MMGWISKTGSAFHKWRLLKNIVLLPAVVLAVAGNAWPRQLSGPVLGFMVDESSSMLRIISGVPGATNIGRAMGGIKLARAAVSRKNDYALAVTKDSHEVILIQTLSGAETVVYLPGVYAGGSGIAISPDESMAAIYSSNDARIQVIRGLPSEPVIQFEADTSAVTAQYLTSMAISAGGEVLAGFSDGNNGSLLLFSAEFPRGRFMSEAGYPAAIMFSVEGALAVAADRARNQVFLFSDLSSGVSRISLANEADGISDPVGIALSRDASTAYVANAGSNSVSIIRLAGGAVGSLVCDCGVRSMQLMRGDSIFAITDRADEPVVLFVGGELDPHFVYVPAARMREPIQFILP
jgi:hypothetical protein